MTDSNYDFPVELKRIKVVDGQLVPNAKAIVRTDTGLPLSVVSDRYHLFSHKQAVDLTQDFLKTFGEHQAVNILEKDGARFIRECTFLDHSLVVRSPKINDIVKFRLSIINSYDRKTSLKIKICAMVLRCLNGMTAVGGGIELNVSHTAGIQEIKLPEPESVLAIFKRSGDSWNKMANTELSSFQVLALDQQVLDREVISKKTYEKYEEEVGKGPVNAWDYYNTYTNILTHRLTRLQMSSRLRRLDHLQQIFQKVLET